MMISRNQAVMSLSIKLQARDGSSLVMGLMIMCCNRGLSGHSKVTFEKCSGTEMVSAWQSRISLLNSARRTSDRALSIALRASFVASFACI